MTNLEHAQNVHDDAKAWLELSGVRGKIALAIDLLGMLIEENRDLRHKRDAVAETMNYGASR